MFRRRFAASRRLAASGRFAASLACFALVAIASVLGCAGTGLPIAGPADVSRASVRWPGTSAGDLERGRHLYGTHCAQCHSPVMPAEVAAAEWPGHIHEMQERAGLTPAEADLVTRYLVTMAATQASR